MNQSTDKSNAEEGKEGELKLFVDHAATNPTESFKEMDSSESNATEEPKAANRKETMKNSNNSTATVTNRKEENKTLTKLADDKLKKPNPAKVMPNTKKLNRTSGLPTSKKIAGPAQNLKPTIQVKSKIPAFKQPPNASNNLKSRNNTSPAAQKPGVQLPHSASKLSATIHSVSKVEPSHSKSSCLTTTSNSAGAKDQLKVQTARTPGSPTSSIQRRSASNMSSRSGTPVVKREETQTNLRKIASIAGDHDRNNNMAKNITSRSSTPIKKVEAENNLRTMLSTAGDQNRVDCLEKKLEDVQTEFLHEMESLNLQENLNREYKILTLIRNAECKLIVKDDGLLKSTQLFPADSISTVKEKIKKCMDDFFAPLVDNLKDTNEDSNINVETAKNKLEQLKILKLNNILSLIDDLCLSQEEGCDTQIVKMQKELQDSKKTLKNLENTLSDAAKLHDEQLLCLEKQLKSNANADLAEKDAEIKDLNNKLKSLEKQTDNLKTSLQNTEKEEKVDKSNLQEELKTSRDRYATLQKKLHTAEQQLTSEKKELKAKNELIKKLESDLAEKKVHELKDKPNSANNCSEHLQQISKLQNAVTSLETEKITMEQKTEMLQAEVAALLGVQTKLKEAEGSVQELQRLLDVKETKNNLEDYAKEVQLEFAKFRQSDAEKRREIEKLKVELSKFQYNMCQLEEEIQRGQQLLEVRCELINSLQTTEKTQRIHMEELFAQIAEKNSAINELNSELCMKSEEFRNLFNTINAKQMELSNQEHMIKLLEDSNERSQMLRVKQEEKIGRMEEELAHLKQTIAIYQANILSGKHSKNILFAPILPASSGGFNENFYYYASQRRRKRQVDINVKKYEA